MKKRKGSKKWLYILMFIVGFLILMYPLVSQYYYRVESGKEIVEFQKKASEMDELEVMRRMELARAYNATLDPSRLADPYSEKEKEGIAEYARMLEIEEKIGFVEIPRINTKIPIYAGTRESVLQRGAGHLEGTSLPIGGKSTHSVITAHRGLPTAELFRHLDKLKIGDVFYIHNLETVLAYEVDQILTVEPSDFDPVLVVDGKDYSTLLTCTPYMINSHRLLVRGHRVSYVAPIDDGVASNRILDMEYRDLIMFEIPICLVLFALLVYYKRTVRKKKKTFRTLKAEIGDEFEKKEE